MYFSRFPYVKYYFPDGEFRTYKNLSIRPHIVERVKEYEYNLIPYYVEEGEMPDHIAYDKYGDPKLHWVIMMSNDMLNLHTDWPKDTQQFGNYLSAKYRKQVTNQDREIDLTDLELQRYVEFVGTTTNKYKSFIIIDSERNGFVKDSELELNDSDEYIMIEPAYLEWTPKDSLNPDIKFETVRIRRDVLFETENAFGYNESREGDFYSVSYYEHEFELNQARRKIKLPRREVLDKILDEFPELVRQ